MATGESLLRELGPDTQALLDTIAAERGMTGEELFRKEGAINAQLQEQVLGDLTNSPFESQLENNLELVRMQVNQEAQRRGVFGGLPEGGIRFEQLA